MSNNFSENDIRPLELKKKQRELIAEDLKYLKKLSDKFVKVNCPACGSSSSSLKYKKNGFKYPECKQCLTVYMSPRPTTDIIFDFLRKSKNYKFWNDVIFPASENIRREKIFKPRVKKVLEICKKFKIPTNSLVEVGSGFGTFLDEIKASGKFKEVVGIEPSTDWAKTCKERGLIIIDKPIEEIVPQDLKANVMVNFEVLEHIFSPKNFIACCYKILDPGGILIITCPSIDGFDIKVMGVASDTIDAEHLNYFNPSSLSSLLESEGFTVIDKQTPGVLDVDLVRNKISAGEFDLKDDFLKMIVVDRGNRLGKKFQHFLQKNLLSSNMLLVAKKNN